MTNLALNFIAARWQFEQAVRERSFDEALISLRAGLRLAPPALKEMHKEYGVTKRIPFIEPSGGAVAAMFNDIECFDLMDELLKLRIVKHKVQIAQYRRDAEIMELVRERLLLENSLSLPELKSLLSADEASRISRLLTWLAKRGELTVIGEGRRAVVHLGVPARAPSTGLPTFRRNGSYETPTPLRISELRIPSEVDFGERSSTSNQWAHAMSAKWFLSVANAVVDEKPLEMSRRQPSVMQSHSTAQGTWLIAKSKEQPDRSFTTRVNRYSPSGEQLSPLELPHRVTRVTSSTSNEHLVTSDAELNVRVYDFDGICVFAASLWETPEVLAIFDEAPSGLVPTRIQQQADARIDRGMIAFSVADSMWIFNLDGELVLARRMPAVPDGVFQILAEQSAEVAPALAARGLPRNMTRRQLASWLDEQDFMSVSFITQLGTSFVVSPEKDGDDDAAASAEDALSEARGLQALIDEVGGLRRDWISLLQFSDDGTGLWIGTESSLLMHLGLTGEIRGIWSFEKTVKRVSEVDGKAFAVLPLRVVQISSGELPREVAQGAGKEMLIQGSILARRQGRDVTVVEVLSGRQKTVELDHDFRGFYPVAVGVRIETKTTVADIAL